MVKKKYACCSLEKFAQIVAWISMIIALAIFITNIVIFYLMYHGSVDYIVRNLFYIFRSVEETWLFGTISSIVASILLIIGIKLKERSFLVPWLVLGAFIAALCIGSGLFMIIIHGNHISWMNMIFPLLFVAFGALGAYAWYGVYSLFQKITTEKKIAAERQVQLATDDNGDPYVHFV